MDRGGAVITEHPKAMAQWVYHLQSTGRYSFTRSQVESDTGRSFLGVQSALRRLKQQKIIVSPRRGFYVIVPPEYRSVGSPPANWFIDDLMRFLGQPYYVGLLSAAAVLSELADRMEKGALVALALIVNTTDVQRLGYLLDKVGYGEKGENKCCICLLSYLR